MQGRRRIYFVMKHNNGKKGKGNAGVKAALSKAQGELSESEMLLLCERWEKNVLPLQK